MPETRAVSGLRLLLLADTHVPARAGDLPAQLWAAVDAADVVVHAGDWMSPALLDTLEARARRLVGVWGNNDGAELRRRLPEVARVELGGLAWGVVHETGAKARREDACGRPTSIWTCWSSGTATSRGTPSTRGCACSTPVRRPTAVANRTAPT